jgi:predicted phosphodiesterase
MPERVAVLSDIHGVLPALEAVLAEPDFTTADRIVILGDIAAGPQPCEVIDLLLNLGDRAAWISGNADRMLVEHRQDTNKSRLEGIFAWAAEQLGGNHLGLLSRLSRSLTMTIDVLGEVLFCHATPRNDEEVVLVDSRIERWDEVFADTDPACRTVVCGHTHMPFVRLANGRLVVNPGSVGMPYGRSGAHWALLGPGVELRRTEFDLDAACARTIAASAFSKVAEWADYYIRARATDVEALQTFGPKDGR